MPVEERIDHAEAKRIAEAVRDYVGGAMPYGFTKHGARRMADLILALLTEHSARDEALKAYATAYPCPGIEVEPGMTSGCDGSGGDCPTCAATESAQPLLGNDLVDHERVDAELRMQTETHGTNPESAQPEEERHG